jgi:hypothetical protein
MQNGLVYDSARSMILLANHLRQIEAEQAGKPLAAYAVQEQI